MEKQICLAGKYKGLLFAVTNVEESQLIWYTMKNEYAAEVALKDVGRDNAIDNEKIVALLENLVKEVEKLSA